MTLMLHSGAKEVAYDLLRSIEPPAPTATHHPIAHHRVVDLVKHSLTFYGHEISDEHHAVTEDGLRYFGVLCLRSPHGDYSDMVGLRNSGDKSFPVGVSFGSRVFVCDNLAFTGDQVIRRRHTPKLKFELPGLIAAIVEPLAIQREAQAKQIQLYKGTSVTDNVADHAILGMFREGIINVQRIADVIAEWDGPTFEDFKAEKNAWRLFNAATHALVGRVAENPSATRKLHTIIDGVCTVH